MTEPSPAPVRLEIVRRLSGTPEDVFAAWTEPQVMKEWFAPPPMSVPSASVDLRPGGTYRVEMLSPGGQLHVAIGSYHEISPPTRLVMSWRWEGQEMPDTLLTIEIRAVKDGSELHLLHERFPSDQSRDQHKAGWEGCLGRLSERFAG